MQIKTANGKQKLAISRAEWESIGKTAGWYDEDVERIEGRIAKVKKEVADIVAEAVVFIDTNAGASSGLKWDEKLRANPAMAAADAAGKELEKTLAEGFEKVMEEVRKTNERGYIGYEGRSPEMQ